MDRWRAGTRDQCWQSQREDELREAALADGTQAERKELGFNAPLPSPSSYFGDDFELAPGNVEQMIQWREQVYMGKKGGPSIVHANEILEAAGAEIVPQASLPELIRTRVVAPSPAGI